MSPTVPTTTNSCDDENNDDPRWMDVRRRPSLADNRRVTLLNLATPVGVDQSTRRQQQDRQLRDPVKGIADDAYNELVSVIGNKEEDNGDCWLMSHQSIPSALEETTMTGNGGVCDHEKQHTIKTAAEFWIHQLRSVLHETRSNLGLIVAFHQRQMQQYQAKQPATLTGEDPSRTLMRFSKSVAVQTDDLELNIKDNVMDESTDVINVDSKLNHYRKSVCQNDEDHRVVGSLIEQLSPAGDNQCHFIRTSSSCCALSAHCLHSCSCCRATHNRRKSSIASQRPSSYPSRINSTSHDMTAILLLNEAWQLAGLQTRQRMSILSRHYRIIYKRHQKLRRRHRRLRRLFQKTRRRNRYVQLQLQILLESIGSQVDDVASDWVGRLKGFLRIEASSARDPTDADGPMGAGSSLNNSYSPFHFAKDSTGHGQKQQQQFRVNGHRYTFSLYRWYSSLSLKLNWLQTSHMTVIENLTLFQTIPST